MKAKNYLNWRDVYFLSTYSVISHSTFKLIIIILTDHLNVTQQVDGQERICRWDQSSIRHYLIMACSPQTSNNHAVLSNKTIITEIMYDFIVVTNRPSMQM